MGRVLSMSKSSAGATYSITVSGHNPVTGIIDHPTIDDMDEAFDEGIAIINDQMYQENLSMLTVYGFHKYFTPDTWQKIISILDILAGRAEPGQIIARWDAIIEENIALEQGRLTSVNAGIAERNGQD